MVSAAVTTWLYWSDVSGFAAGLSTVGYTVYAHDGSTPGRTGAGVVALGTDGYGALVTVPFTGGYSIQWDDGQSPPTYSNFDTIVPVAVETNGFNIQQVLSLILAQVVGQGTGFSAAGATQGQYLAPDNDTVRVFGSCDPYGNRTSSLNPPT